MSEAIARVLPAGFMGLTRVQQALLLLVGLLLPAALFVGSQWVSDGQYVPLFASLTTEDAGAVLNQLKASKTPYRIAGNGDQILVPADRVAELRLRLAVQGLPLGGGVGFEVFDKPALGVSDFTQRLNYQRALQGELARTIGQLREVARARVHLVLPQPSVFAERERPASASVFVRLTPGAQLGREQIRGIVQLVASSVEGLSPDRVTVVDTAGHVLSAASEPAGNPMSSRRIETKVSLEEGIERRLQTLLDTTMGVGHAVVRVSAQLNFDQVEKTEEKFDPRGVTRQRTRSTENNKARTTAPAPVATAPDPANPQGPTSSGALTQNDNTRETETISYEVSRIVAKTLTTPGELQRLSVSVIVDTPVKIVQTSDKKEVREPQPRTPEELEKIRKVVMGAIGFNEQRGDQVTVVDMTFDTTAQDRERAFLEQPATPAAPAVRPPANLTVVGAAVGGVAVLGFVAWLMLRGRSRRRALAEVALSLAAEAPSAAGAAAPARPVAQPRQAAPLVPEEILALTREREDIRQRATAMASAEPEASAQLVRAWLVKKKPAGTGRGGNDGV
jgi:flagellar M-ring protein FliF